jgi:hypothetical protein
MEDQDQAIILFSRLQEFLAEEPPSLSTQQEDSIQSAFVFRLDSNATPVDAAFYALNHLIYCDGLAQPNRVFVQLFPAVASSLIPETQRRFALHSSAWKRLRLNAFVVFVYDGSYSWYHCRCCSSFVPQLTRFSNELEQPFSCSHSFGQVCHPPLP